MQNLPFEFKIKSIVLNKQTNKQTNQIKMRASLFAIALTVAASGKLIIV